MRPVSLMVFSLFALISLGIGCAAARDAQEVEVSNRDGEVSQVASIDNAPEAPLVSDITFTAAIEEMEVTSPVDVQVESRKLAVTDFAFTPNVITVPADKLIEITIDVLEGEHTFVAEELGINEELTLGEILSFTSPSTPGRYTFYCGIGPNRGLGMEGVIVVE
ncbi:cupredoxin domain-containing protein [Patescibacteria group bacterium]|nr:cupredoxin domain-containing protein [Patescibacteria group bacterium]